MSAHARRIAWIVFWVAVVILGLLVVPVMRNTGAIPMMIFAIIILAIGSALFGSGVIGRQMAVRGATVVLVLAVLSFFLPQTAKRVPEKVKAFDTWLATSTPRAPVASVPAAAPVPPTDQCTARPGVSCKMRVDWGGSIKTGGRPVSILFHEKKEWYLFSGSGPIPLSAFAPGEAEFAPPDNTPVHVKIFQ